MNFATWSLRNTNAATLIFILLTFAGLWGFNKLNVQDFPDLDFPVVMVSLSQPGAAPAQLETEVARKVEDSLANLTLLRHINTTVSSGNVSIAVEFELEKKLSDAVADVKTAIDSIRNDLPTELLEPQVSKLEMAGGEPTLVYAVSSDTRSETELSWYVDNRLAKKVMSVGGVGEFTRLGGVTREIQVHIDPIKLNALGATATDVSMAIKQIQQENSGGRTELGDSEQTVRTIATLKTVDELKELPITLPSGETFKLSQLANVIDTNAERAQIALLDGKHAIGFKVVRAKGFDEPMLAEEVISILDTLAEEDSDIKFTLILSSVPRILEQYDGSMNMLYEGSLLAMVVIFFFLRDWRATMIGAIALPLSIIPTFAFMYWAGYSLNTITLLAMAVVVGVLVDDAIVEVENIARHQRMGKSVKQATIDAVNEIAKAVIATTATLVVVFLPTAMMDGIPGLIFKQFGWTLVVAVLFSLLVARIVTPMAAVLLLKDNPHQEKEGTWMPTYLKAAAWCLKHRKTTLGGGLLFFIFSISLLTILPAGFIPTSDEMMTNVQIETPPGNNLHNTLQKAEAVRLAIKDVDGVNQIFTTVGSGNIGDVRTATLMVVFNERGTRPTQTEIENAMREKLNDIAGIKLSMGAGGPGEKLQINLVSDDAVALAAAAKDIERDIRSLPYLSGVSSTASLEQQEIQIIPNLTQASERGVSTQAIGETLRIALSGDYDQVLAKLNLDQRQLRIRAMLPPEMRQDVNTLANLRLHSNNGLIPLKSIASINIGSAPAQILRVDRNNSVSITADLGGHSLDLAMKDINKLAGMKNLPDSVTPVKKGDAEMMEDLLLGFAIALIIGIFCVYAVLVLLFENWLQPITILSAVPLSMGGAFVALLVGNSELGLPALIGLIMLLGIVTKNSILLVDFAVIVMEENKGISKNEAMLKACSMRARPILMTTIAMIAGMLPLVIGFSGDPSFRRPMAIAVIGGLITSTGLSLLVVPVVFSYMTGLEQRIKKLFTKTVPVN